MLTATKDKIALEVAEWRNAGLIDNALAATLAERFETGPRLLSTALRWLGFFAMFMFVMSILGLVGMTLGEAALQIAPFLLGALSAAAWFFGVRMATDSTQHYPTSGAVLVTAGLAGIFGALTLLFFTLGGENFEPVYPGFMAVTAAAAVATAYRYGLRWPLALGILVMFHALGNWHGYAGHGTYWLGIRDERVTAIAALLALGVGFWHEQSLEMGSAGVRWLGFGHLFVIFGLLYVNVSVWFLSLFPGGLAWVLAFTAVCLAQLVAGARLHDSRFVGFGIVFLGIDLYTRFYEHFWNGLSKAEFFLLAGAVGVAAGTYMERLARQRRGA
jgi:hypothetical protein